MSVWIRLIYVVPALRTFSTQSANSGHFARAAKASYEAFGNVHVVCNNAGVAGRGGIDNISLDNWRWVLDINLMGSPLRHPYRPAAHPRLRRQQPHRQHRVRALDGIKSLGTANS
jgi:NAD(P)-dependent dehydrogenase (short-subunit alcohol dehydrogenase family)